MSDTPTPTIAGKTFETANSGNQFIEDKIYISIVSSSTGQVNKTFFLKDGRIDNHSNANIYQGTAETSPADTPEELREIIQGLKPNQAIALGRLKQPHVKVPLTTKAKLQPGAISRSKAFFTHNEGPGYLLADIDTKDLPPEVVGKISGRPILEVLYEVLPEWLDTARLVRASSSAGIRRPDGTEQPATGYHVYLRVRNQSESKALLRLMHDRLWEAGYGYILVGKDGSLYERSLIDTAVYGPERLIFEAEPRICPPLMRRRIADKAFVGGDLATITPADPELVNKLKQDAKQVVKPKMQQAKLDHEASSVKRLMKTHKLTQTEAKKTVRQRREGRELADHDILEVGKGQFVRVSTFLDTAAGAIGMPCPIEGSEYGTSTAYYYPADEYRPYPRIISFAHGNTTEFTFARFRHLKGLRLTPKGAHNV